MGNLPLKSRNYIRRKIDHIVYAVSNLEESIAAFEKKLGVRPIFGGYHTTFGTKNALVNLGHHVYLELLAVDELNTKVSPPRWMGVDLLTKNQITRWAITSNTLEKDSQVLQKYKPKMGSIQSGSRNTTDGFVLQWQLIMPLPAPEVELVPFVLDWSETEKHPAELLPNMGCQFVEIYGTHPNAKELTGVLNELNCGMKIQKADRISLRLVINTPKGTIEI